MARDSAAEFFGRALAAARSERGLKRMQLKELSGLSYPYISEIENGGKYPSQRAIQALADSLGMSPSELVGRAERIESEEVDACGGEDRTTTEPVSPPPMMPAEGANSATDKRDGSGAHRATLSASPERNRAAASGAAPTRCSNGPPRVSSVSPWEAAGSNAGQSS